jgi:hypothetical protein
MEEGGKPCFGDSLPLIGSFVLIRNNPNADKLQLLPWETSASGESLPSQFVMRIKASKLNTAVNPLPRLALLMGGL